MRIDSLLKAKYKEFEILVLSETESGGRKLVVFDYPNSSSRTIQDLGGLPQTFTIQCVLAGSSYLAKAERFRSLLVDGNSGSLVLQSIGTVDAKVDTYQRNFRIEQTGIVVFDITFQIENMLDTKKKFPIVTEQDIYNEFYNSQDTLASTMLNLKLDPTTEFNTLMQQSDIGTACKNLKETFDNVENAASNLEKSLAEINDMIFDTANYVDRMVTNSVFGEVVASGKNAYTKCKSLCNYGYDFVTRVLNSQSTVDLAKGGEYITDLGEDFNIPVWDFNTVEIRERNKSRIVLTETTRANAILTTFQQVVVNGVLGETLEEINLIKNDLAKIFDELLNGSQGKHVFADNTFLSDLINFKNLIDKYIQQKEEFVYHQTTLDVAFNVPSILSYDLYIDEEKTRDNLDKKAELLTQINDYKQIFKGITNILERS